MVGRAQLLDDARRCLATVDGAGGELAAELAGLLVDDLVSGRVEQY